MTCAGIKPVFLMWTGLGPAHRVHSRLDNAITLHTFPQLRRRQDDHDDNYSGLKRGNSMFKVADMIQNAFKALMYNMRHKKYKNMYGKRLIEEPEHHEPSHIYLVHLSNCMICKYSRVTLFGFGYVNGNCTHKHAEKCNSYKLTDARCQGTDFKYWQHCELEALEHCKQQPGGRNF